MVNTVDFCELAKVEEIVLATDHRAKFAKFPGGGGGGAYPQISL